MQPVLDALDVFEPVFADCDHYRQVATAALDIKAPAPGLDRGDGLRLADPPMCTIGIDPADAAKPPVVVHEIAAGDATNPIACLHSRFAMPDQVSVKASLKPDRARQKPLEQSPVSGRFPGSRLPANDRPARLRALKNQEYCMREGLVPRRRGRATDALEAALGDLLALRCLPRVDLAGFAAAVHAARGRRRSSG